MSVGNASQGPDKMCRMFLAFTSIICCVWHIF